MKKQTSAVDNETERLIQESMERIRIDWTVVIIAHRLTTIRNADFVYVLDEGKIVERGNHDSLLAQNGVYAKLWASQ